jgi:hypothetical protein
MSDEWGPWIELDGAQPLIPLGVSLKVAVLGSGIRPEPGAVVSLSWPGFYWRWRTVRVGLFRSERRRVCDDPSYAPIIRYRIRRPRALLELIDLVENLPAPHRESEFS